MQSIIRISTLLFLAAVASPADVTWIDADGVRIVEPPHEHPRLYLRARDLQDVRRRMTHPTGKCGGMGGSRPAVVASADAGVLYFEGSVGTYSLRR